MKATYNDFLEDNRNCSGFQDNLDAQKIFDFLNRDDIIIMMIDASDQGKPALAGCVTKLEDYYKSLNSSILDFTDDFTRTVIGRMIKAVLKPFGYRVATRRGLGKGVESVFFTAAACYTPKDPDTNQKYSATMHVVKRVESIQK